jgi:hypothetical protein
MSADVKSKTDYTKAAFWLGVLGFVTGLLFALLTCLLTYLAWQYPKPVSAAEAPLNSDASVKIKPASLASAKASNPSLSIKAELVRESPKTAKVSEDVYDEFECDFLDEETAYEENKPTEKTIVQPTHLQSTYDHK